MRKADRHRIKMKDCQLGYNPFLFIFLQALLTQKAENMYQKNSFA